MDLRADHARPVLVVGIADHAKEVVVKADRRVAGQRDDRRDRGGFGRGRDQDRGSRFEAPPVVQGLAVNIEPDVKAVEAMAQMIRTAGKAYSVFDAAKLVLSSGDRFDVVFTRDAEGAPKFTTIPADGSVWITREEAMAHLMQSDVLSQFYRAEEIEARGAQGGFHQRRCLRIQRRASRPAESSQLSNVAASHPSRTLQQHRFRRLQTPRAHRCHAGSRREMEGVTEARHAVD